MYLSRCIIGRHIIGKCEASVMKPPIAIMWFKRDLRIYDHRPLCAAIEASQANGQAILPLFVVEPDYWQLPTSSRRHWVFVRECLVELRAALASLGQPLVVRIGGIDAVLDDLSQHFSIKTLYSHEETSQGWSYARDNAVRAYCARHHIAVHDTTGIGVFREDANCVFVCLPAVDDHRLIELRR